MFETPYFVLYSNTYYILIRRGNQNLSVTMRNVEEKAWPHISPRKLCHRINRILIILIIVNLHVSSYGHVLVFIRISKWYKVIPYLKRFSAWLRSPALKFYFLCLRRFNPSIKPNFIFYKNTYNHKHNQWISVSHTFCDVK